jgi:hypothetical protein
MSNAMNVNDYRELRIKAYVRLDNPDLYEAIDALEVATEGMWDLEYWTIFDKDFAEWLEELATERLECGDEEVSND